MGRPGGGPGGSLMPVGKRCGGAVGRVEGVCVGRVGRASVVPVRKKCFRIFTIKLIIRRGIFKKISNKMYTWWD